MSDVGRAGAPEAKADARHAGAPGAKAGPGHAGAPEARADAGQAPGGRARGRGRVLNVHERRLEAGPEAVGALLESLAGPEDRLWPSRRWPPMRLDRGLEPGSDGGHGPVRYAVARHEPGRSVAFAFTPAFPLHGEHRFEVVDAAGGAAAILRHSLEGAPRGWLRLGWPLCFRWLHDALVEDALDRAAADLAGAAWRPRPLPAHVRLLRRLLGGRRRDR